MALESFSYINSLNTAAPTASDPRSEGDDHLRGVKLVLKQTFPNLDAPCNATPAQINYLIGLTGSIQTQLDTKAPIASPALTGSPTAPTQSAGDNSTKLATTAYVDQRAFSTSLPTQTSHANKYLQTDGENASWQPIVLAPSVAYSLGAL